MNGGAAPKGREFPPLLLERIGQRIQGTMFTGGMDIDPHTTKQVEGGVIIGNIMPGVYRPVLPPGAREYVQGMSYNGQTVVDGTIDVGGADGELDLALAPATASIGGKVKGEGAAAVLVVAENATPGNPAFQEAIVDRDGRFSVPYLSPGRYLAFAIPRGGRWPWENQEFVKLLGDQAAAVELTENGSAQVEVALLTEEALRGAQEQIP
jgi:hypothetical protein